MKLSKKLEVTIMKVFLLLFLLVSIQSNCAENAQTQIRDDAQLKSRNDANAKPSESEQECVRTTFKYLIVQDILAWESQRHLIVFLDEEAFSESNLIELYSKLSKRYSEYSELIIAVETNWKRIPLSTYCPSGSSENSTGENRNEFHRALFYRKSGSEHFTYNPKPNTSDYKTVVLKQD